MELHEVLLPGVGVRYEFGTRAGESMAVVARRTGEFDVVVYDRRDPDRPRETFRLDADEAEAVAQLLGAPRIAERIADLSREVPGLASGQVEVAPGSPYDGRTLGDTRARTRTGASVVALVRGEEVHASPGPEAVLAGGDVLVVIGTPEGIDAVTRLARDG